MTSPSGKNLPLKLFLICGAAFIAFTAWGAFDPLHLNWGVSALGFYPASLQVGSLILMALFLWSGFQDRVRSGAEKLTAPPGSFRARVSLAGVLLGSVVLWLTFQPGLHLLGDGAILLRSIPNYSAAAGIPQSFRNQPLLWIVFKLTELVLEQFTAPSAHDVYVALDLLGGVGLVLILAMFLKTRRVEPAEKLLAGVVLMAGGGSQFFFGYVENYVLQYVVTAAYLISGWLVLEKRVRIWLPAVLFVALVGLHIGDLIYAPSLLYLAAADRGMDFGANKGKILAAAGIAAAGSIGLLLALGVNVGAMAAHFINGSTDFIPLIPGNGDYYPYSMFSVWHVIDWLNALMNTAPLALPMLIAGALASGELPLRKRPAFLFLCVGAFGGFLFTWIVNSALGQARDWDLMAGFFVPLMVLGVFAVVEQPRFGGRPRILAAAAGISLLHLALFVGVNADAGRHLARAESLNDPRLLAVSSRLFQREALANYFFDNGEYDKARRYYEQYNATGTLNPRVIANLSDCYRKLEMKDEYFGTLKKAAQINSPNPGVYSNLAVEYVTRGDTAMAIAMNQRCVAMDSLQNQAYANLAVVYLNVGKYDSCVVQTNFAVHFGFTDPVIYRVMGKALLKLARYDEAVLAYDRYLAAKPGDTPIREQRNRVAALLGKPPSLQ